VQKLPQRYQKRVRSCINCVVSLAEFGVLLTLIKGGVDLFRHGQLYWQTYLQSLSWLLLGDVGFFSIICLIECGIARRKWRKQQG